MTTMSSCALTTVIDSPRPEPLDYEYISPYLAPFNPSSDLAVENALRLLKRQNDDIVYDLGAGDGKFILKAAASHPQTRFIGIDIDKDLIDRARTKRKLFPYLSKAEFFTGNLVTWSEAPFLLDIFEARPYHRFLDTATVIYIFLVPKGIARIRKLLDQVVARRKSEGRSLRIITHMFNVPGWTPSLIDRSAKAEAPLYLYSFESLRAADS